MNAVGLFHRATKPIKAEKMYFCFVYFAFLVSPTARRPIVVTYLNLTVSLNVFKQ